MNGELIVRTISAEPENPGHPFSLAESTTLETRRSLLIRLKESAPAHVLPVGDVCDCSFTSPWLEGTPLQDHGLGPDADRLVTPEQRRVRWHPRVLERMLAELAGGLANLHQLGVAHGDPAMMNGYCVTTGDEPTALWVDLNSVRPASADSVAVDIAGFLNTCLWPCLLDADQHSPALFRELVELETGASCTLERIAETLRATRSDHAAGNARGTLAAALADLPAGERSPFARHSYSIRSLMTPAYFLDQTRTDQTARFLQAVLNAERARNRLLDEERTRLLNLRFEGELARSQAAIDELRTWARELQGAIDYQNSRADDAEAATAALQERLDQAGADYAALQEELAGRDAALDEIHRSRAWRLVQAFRAARRVAGRLVNSQPDAPPAPAGPPATETAALGPDEEPEKRSPPVPADLMSYLPSNFPANTYRPVLLFLPWFVTGGADRVVEYLLEHWRRVGRTVVVFTTTPLGENMHSRFDELFELTPFAYDLNAMGSPEGWMAFVDAIIERLENPAVLNIGSRWLYDSLEELKSNHPRLRVVDQQFNDIGHLDSNRRVRASLDATVAAHRNLLEAILLDGREPDRAEVVYVGIPEVEPATRSRIDDFRARLGIRPGARVVLFLGRLSEEKRPEWALGLAATLAPEKDVVVLLVGSGPEASKLTEGIQALPNLIWRNYVDDVAVLYGAADLLILPSKIEGIPLTIMEALALGVPVVASRVGGLGEFEGLPGVQLFESDDFETFVDLVRRTLSEAPPTGISLPQRYSVGHMVESYDRLIDGPKQMHSTATSHETGA